MTIDFGTGLPQLFSLEEFPIECLIESPPNIHPEEPLDDKIPVEFKLCSEEKKESLVQREYKVLTNFLSDHRLSNTLILKLFAQATNAMEKKNRLEKTIQRMTQSNLWSLCPEQIFLKLKNHNKMQGRLLISDNPKKVSICYRSKSHFKRIDTEEVMSRILLSVLDTSESKLDPGIHRWLIEKSDPNTREKTSSTLSAFYLLFFDQNEFASQLKSFKIKGTFDLTRPKGGIERLAQGF